MMAGFLIIEAMKGLLRGAKTPGSMEEENYASE
jgi:hypothetical protein